MNLKDMYELINSNAVANHCRSINHKFNTEELAVLIFRNKKLNVEEKIAAYKELIENHPDMEVIERINCDYYSSVKTMIQGEINRLTSLITAFNKSEEDIIYSYVPFYKSTEEYASETAFYNTHKTLKKVTDNIEEAIKEYDDFLMYHIHKKYLSKDYIITAEYIVKDKMSIMVNIDDSKGEMLDIEGICLNIPTPFKKGDILQFSPVSHYRNGTILQGRGIPFVLDWMITWREKFSEYLAKGNCDSSDMNGYGYYAMNPYNHEKKVVYLDHVYDYDSFEYFDHELEGMERILKAISSLMNEDIDIMLFLHAYEQIKLEENTNVNLNWFTKEGLELAGIIKKSNN
jgi:hypothetical protein